MTIKYKKQSSKRRSFSFILTIQLKAKKNIKGNKKYLVSLYAMIIDDGKYFFTGFEDEEKIVKTFRIDKVDLLINCIFWFWTVAKIFQCQKIYFSNKNIFFVWDFINWSILWICCEYCQVPARCGSGCNLPTHLHYPQT